MLRILLILFYLITSSTSSFLLKNPSHISTNKLIFDVLAHKTGTGNTKNNRDSRPKYLGLKRFHNMFVYTGNIIVRQRGAHFKPGPGSAMGRDFTIYAKRSGRLQILKRRISVLDLLAENEYIKELNKNYESPTINTLSKIWTKKTL